tara:strand:- start:600 stop:1277 length:678 start_codon:yes stop_codon:yes gene_type:complete
MIAKQLNLLNTFPKTARNIESRKLNKEINRKLALEFGYEYFDGTREQGYGGYTYDGRWIEIAKELVDIFNLKDGSNFLDVGCAKGYLIYDLYNLNNNINVYGLDISEYAKKNSIEKIRENISIGNCKKLNYENNFFDCVVSINTVHNLDIEECKIAIKEIQRVSNGKAFIQVDAYRNDEELDLFKDWMLTAKTYLKPKEWLKLFEEVGYTGYYYWTILEKSGETV